MRLVYDHGKTLARKLADLVHDHREFLEGSDDNGLAGLKRLFELARGRVDIFHYAKNLLELPYGPSEADDPKPAGP